MPGWPQVAVVINETGPSEQSEDLAGVGSFEQPQNLFFGAAVGQLARDVVAKRQWATHLSP